MKIAEIKNIETKELVEKLEDKIAADSSSIKTKECQMSACSLEYLLFFMNPDKMTYFC